MNPTLQINNQQSNLRVFIEVESAGKHITRLGAVLYDSTAGREVAVFDRTVGEEEFATALQGLVLICSNYPVWTFSDAQQKLERECRHYAVAFPFRRPFVQVKALLAGWGVRASQYSAGTLYRAAGLKDDGGNGVLHDARSVAKTVNFFEDFDLL